MRIYPDVPARRARTLAGDLAVLLSLLLLAWLGLTVHDTVNELGSLGRGVQGAGNAVQDGFRSAADAVGRAPVVGGEIAERLREGGQESGGRVASAGRRGEDAVHDLADLLGLLTFGLPAALLLWRTLPPRIAQVRSLTAAERVIGDAADPGRRRALATRALCSLPYGALLRHTRDPLGDLAAERYDALVAAAFEDAGLRPSSPGPRAAELGGRPPI